MAKSKKPRLVTENEIEIAASPEVVWTCFADLEKWPSWFPALQKVEWIAGIAWTKGAQFRQDLRLGFPFGQVNMIATIFEISTAPYIAWEAELAGMEAIQGFRFNNVEGGTRALVRQEFYGARAIYNRLFFFPRRVEKAYEDGLAGLKRYVETGTVQLRMSM